MHHGRLSGHARHVLERDARRQFLTRFLQSLHLLGLLTLSFLGRGKPRGRLFRLLPLIVGN